MTSSKQIKRDELDELIAATVEDGMTIAAGGFGLAGTPFGLINSLARVGRKDLTVISNNMGIEGVALGRLLDNHQVKKVIASYIGDNMEFARQYLDGEIEIEFNPQGTLAERLRTAGAGIPAFYTPTGVGTVIAEGKPTATFDGKEYVLERALVADVAFVHAYQADEGGNLVYRLAARNFNPVCAESGRVTIAEAEHIVPRGSIDPDWVMTPSVHVDHIVQDDPSEKVVEKVTVRPRPEK